VSRCREIFITGLSSLEYNAQHGMLGRATTKISIIDIRHDALEEKMSQVISTTIANTEALHEVKLVFTKYMARLKQNFDKSPLVSKFAVDSNCPVVLGGMQLNETTELALSKEPADDIVETMNTQGEVVIASKSILQPTTLPQSPNASPSLVVGGVSQKNPKAHVVLQRPKDVVPKKAEDALA
jgi:hypothetical protein